MLESKVQRFFQICSINLKISWIYNICLSLILFMFIPLLYDIENTNISSAATICEQYVSLIGIILLAPVFKPEQQNNINELIETKPVSQLLIYIIRIVVSVVILFVLINIFVGILKLLGGEFNTMKFVFGTFATAIFLGSISILVNSITNFTLAGYMVSFGFLLYEITNKTAHIGYKFHILSLFRDSFIEKYYLFAGGGAILLLSLFVCYLKRRLKYA